MEDDSDQGRQVQGDGYFFWLGGGDTVPAMVTGSTLESTEEGIHVGRQLDFDSWVREFLGARWYPDLEGRNGD